MFCFFVFSVLHFLVLFLHMVFNKTSVILQPFGPTFFDKKAPPSKKTRFFNYSSSRLLFFGPFHISVDFRVLREQRVALRRDQPEPFQRLRARADGDLHASPT